MSKLCLLVTGLAALAQPAPDDPSAKVLLRKIDRPEEIGGQKIPPHHGILRYTGAASGGGAAAQQDHQFGGETVTFLPADAARPDVLDKDQFVAIGPGLTSPLPTKPAFRNGTGDTSIMSGRVVLTGGSISPIQLNAVFDLVQATRTLTAELQGSMDLVGGSLSKLPEPRRIANGFLHERELPDGVAPSIQIGAAAAVALAPTPAAQLGFLAGEAGDVYVVWVVNTATVPEQGVAGNMVSAGLGFDPDFNLLYDFVVEPRNAAAARLVPQIFFADPQGPGDPPGRCSPGVAA